MSKDDVLTAIKSMSIMEVYELVKDLEEEFGVSAQAPAMVATAPGVTPAEAEAKPEEKTEFDVVLSSVGQSKVKVIKVVREVNKDKNIGLKEAKDLVDAAEKEPKVIREGVSKEEAEEIKKKLEEVGASAEYK
ncbi:MAG TPA: 50S ribosomal protein L7/L12 [Firmicutes bacterium]|uniref:Large ribosomal subunit protein bL12 n=1 Tax=Candidatus Coatesbacteria bacterium 4484_99 TaxID=1970774 RepID=A0A1W9S3D7_9BACT|nr:MAG: 50S ribosomal protein L7/L12 [Candidatus Coatesbacteria bacterium 4484_99]RLC42571.1 MAG: 50S ribosomal protein L7/L12 [Candidatus Coatesbacteria bacterium]RLC43432.1 MAG: 50S ribosomal protein L7/L12 [Candidatus Coatesbacteria bacterium]RLC43904.1 MAG: 50S ribosomal protein L7/L12 [Candidatus Coatesbacteria bacterium]HDM42837.1 50S ribosomal protein L7/L12 [Bacillota bacterium]